jgi:transketolase
LRISRNRDHSDRVFGEVSLCVNAHEELLAQGIRSLVVPMPSWDIFEHQPQAYQDSVLPPDVTARVAVDQALTLIVFSQVAAQKFVPCNRTAVLPFVVCGFTSM